ncbi:hypothetical protein BpHYR1_043513 [Brachionus plicatilis]|uniref:Uncharacterized protein n=1 Tax=Brachionus plicatilis TaxID=10195 RepID=A0A3M7RJX6_BRAPC|nr:hypothetical protein BpHYR1_043513 [Brachionus plicatilis]
MVFQSNEIKIEEDIQAEVETEKITFKDAFESFKHRYVSNTFFGVLNKSGLFIKLHRKIELKSSSTVGNSVFTLATDDPLVIRQTPLLRHGFDEQEPDSTTNRKFV